MKLETMTITLTDCNGNVIEAWEVLDEDDTLRAELDTFLLGYTSEVVER